jgi:hypothetical protein
MGRRGPVGAPLAGACVVTASRKLRQVKKTADVHSAAVDSALSRA